MARRQRAEPRHRALAGVCLLAVIVYAPANASAQLVTAAVDAGVVAVGYADSLSQRAASVAPSIRIDAPWASANASGLYAQNTDGSWTTQGAAGASLYTPMIGGIPWLRGELAASAGGSTHRDGTQTGAMLLQGRLRATRPSWGGWLGGGAGQTWDGAAWRRLTLGDAGAWAGVGATQLVATATPTIVNDGSGSRIRYTDVQGALHWLLPRVTFAASLGTRLGQNFGPVPGDITTWGSASAVVWLFPSVGVVASGGNYPIDFTQGFPGGRYASIGLRLESRWRHGDVAPRMGDLSLQTAHPAPTVPKLALLQQFTVRDTLDGSGQRLRAFRVRADGATRVDIAGDFTNWQPHPMAAEGGGWWMIATPIASGVHQLTIRVNGGRWLVPPGLSPLVDEFGGTVGVVVVQ